VSVEWSRSKEWMVGGSDILVLAEDLVCILFLFSMSKLQRFQFVFNGQNISTINSRSI